MNWSLPFCGLELRQRLQRPRTWSIPEMARILACAGFDGSMSPRTEVFFSKRIGLRTTLSPSPSDGSLRDRCRNLLLQFLS